MDQVRRAEVYVHNNLAGWLEEIERKRRFRFRYRDDYDGPAVSLTLPLLQKVYDFDSFPAFFDGLLPEGVQLEGLLRQAKVDRGDSFGQLLAVGADMVGAVTVKEAK